MYEIEIECGDERVRVSDFLTITNVMGLSAAEISADKNVRPLFSEIGASTVSRSILVSGQFRSPLDPVCKKYALEHGVLPTRALFESKLQWEDDQKIWFHDFDVAQSSAYAVGRLANFSGGMFAREDFNFEFQCADPRIYTKEQVFEGHYSSADTVASVGNTGLSLPVFNSLDFGFGENSIRPGANGLQYFFELQGSVSDIFPCRYVFNASGASLIFRDALSGDSVIFDGLVHGKDYEFDCTKIPFELKRLDGGSVLDVAINTMKIPMPHGGRNEFAAEYASAFRIYTKLWVKGL